MIDGEAAVVLRKRGDEQRPKAIAKQIYTNCKCTDSLICDPKLSLKRSSRGCKGGRGDVAGSRVIVCVLSKAVGRLTPEVSAR